MRIARRRAWLVVLLMAVAGGAAWVNSTRETPIYAASATMLITPGQGISATDYNSIIAGQTLAETYRALADSSPVLDRVIADLGLPLDFRDLEKMITTSVVGDTQLVQISVEDTDSQRAAAIANEVVDEFSSYVTDQADARAEATQGDIDAQIEALEARIIELDSRLAQLGNGQDAATQQQIADLSAERTLVNESLMELNNTTLALTSQMMASSSQVEPAVPARIPDSPVSPRPILAMLIGLLAGFMVGVGVVALLEFLDNTVKPEQNLEALAGGPVLATVSALNKLKPGGAQVFSLTQPRSSASEALRLLRTNLEFASASGEIHSLTVTSPGPGEGKSTITANLGVVMAQAGLSVVIIDADLRKPTQHSVFSIANDRGLTTLLTHPEENWRSAAAKVALPGLLLVPSGPIPPNPSDLVSGGRFAQVIERIKADVDLVILDSPPLLSASDALAIAARTDGVMLVCRSHHTRIDALRHAAHSVHQGGIRLIGLVVNRQQGQRGASYYGQYYGSTATQGD